VISFRIFIDGRFAYHGLFACSVDAVVDAIGRGARKVKVVPA
jgi:hypothetical protein